MRLIDVCEFIVDCPHSTSPDEGTGFPLIRTPNIGKGRLILENVHKVSEKVYHARTSRAVPQDDDLIFAREAPAGNIAIIKNGAKVCLGQRTVLIRPDRTKVFPDFLVYYMLAPQQQHNLLKFASGATVPHVNLPDIRNLHISLPSYSAQQKIAGILSAYDDLIENNQKQIQLLEEAAQRLYKEWFVDLRFPGHENTRIVDGVPEGWEPKTLGDIITICYGKDHKRIPAGDIPIYGSGGVMRYCSCFLYDGESILIPRKGSLNNIFYVDEKFWTVDTMFYSKIKHDNAGIFTYFFIRSFDMYSLNIGAAVPSMTVNILNSLKIIIPEAKILKKFQNITQKYFLKKNILLLQNEKLIETRNHILINLMKKSH